MNTHNLGSSDLIKLTEAAVKDERRATMVVLHHLREIERRKLYSKFGYASLFAMATTKFGYSEASAQRRINAMRLIRDMPEAEKKIASGELSLTSAANVQSFFREKKVASTTEKLEVISACLNKSTRNVEKELAARNPEKEKREDIRYTKSDRLRMSLNISEDLYTNLEVAKHENGFKTVESLLHDMLEFYLKARVTPAAEVASARLISTPAAEVVTTVKVATPALEADRHSTPAPKTRYISNITKKIVIKRNPEKRCEYVDPITNERCCETEQLQFDHQIPFSKGGPNITYNLRQLCGEHNRHVWLFEQSKI